MSKGSRQRPRDQASRGEFDRRWDVTFRREPEFLCPECQEHVPLTEEAVCPAREGRLTRQRCPTLDRAYCLARSSVYAGEFPEKGIAGRASPDEALLPPGFESEK